MIAAAIRDRQGARAQRTEITAEQVLQHWHDIATADPNELMQLRRRACRYCHGIDHRFQWRDRDEHAEACLVEDKAAAKAERSPEYPSNEGGYGYDPHLDPTPACPKCDGEGLADVHIADTRKLKGKARLLYAGIKQTRDGVEIKTRDQDKALELVARHLGMLNDKLQLQGDADKPLQINFSIPRPPKE